MSLMLPKVDLLQLPPYISNRKFMGINFKDVKSKVLQLPILICFFSFSLFFSQDAAAQTYTGTASFMVTSNGTTTTYSFDYSYTFTSATEAALTVTYTTPTPPGLVPQLHLGGGVFVGMSGSNPYTYNTLPVSGGDVSFQFWMAYAGGLYSSPEPVTNANSTLPISLFDFSANAVGTKSVNLDWKTSTETNSDYFGIERSIDGVNWDYITEVRAAGNSTTDLSYSYLDTYSSFNRSEVSILYYRLKMTDQDATFEYSDIRGVNFTSNNNGVISVYPNPTLDRINIDLTDVDMQVGDVKVGMYDQSGREVMTKNVIGSGIELIDATNLTSATYHIIVTQGSDLIYQTTVIKAD